MQLLGVLFVVPRLVAPCLVPQLVSQYSVAEKILSSLREINFMVHDDPQMENRLLLFNNTYGLLQYHYHLLDTCVVDGWTTNSHRRDTLRRLSVPWLVLLMPLYYGTEGTHSYVGPDRQYVRTRNQKEGSLGSLGQDCLGHKRGYCKQ